MFMLHATVTEIISGTRFTDHRRRVTLRIAEADSMFNELQIANDDLKLEQVVSLEWLPDPAPWTDDSPVIEPPEPEDRSEA